MDQRRNRGGAFHRIRKPDVKRQLRRLAERAHHQQKRHRQQQSRGTVVPVFSVHGLGLGHLAGTVGVQAEQTVGRVQNLLVLNRAEDDKDRKQAEGETEIADPIDDERLFGRRHRRGFAVVIADQQVTGGPDPFPAQKQKQQVVGHHQAGHREDEQTDVGEEAWVSVIPGHVARCVNGDQRADAGDDHQHHHRQRIDVKREVGAEAAPRLRTRRGNPGEVMHGRRSVLAQLGQAGPDHQRADERSGDRGDHQRRGQAPCRIASAAAEQAADDHRHERQRWNQLRRGFGEGTQLLCGRQCHHDRLNPSYSTRRRHPASGADGTTTPPDPAPAPLRPLRWSGRRSRTPDRLGSGGNG